MKKILLIVFIILFSFNCFAEEDLFAMIPLPVVAGVSCSSCTGGTLFVWHFESETNVKAGNPCGCSLGDDTPTETQYPDLGTPGYDGTYALDADAHGFYTFDGVNEDIADFDEGSVIIYADVKTYFVEYIYRLNYDAANYVGCYPWGVSGNWDVRCIYEGQDDMNIILADCNLDEATEGWFRLTHEWKVGEAGNDHYVGIDTDLDGTDDCTATADHDHTALSAAAKAAFDLELGARGVGRDFWLDFITIKNTSRF